MDSARCSILSSLISTVKELLKGKTTMIKDNGSRFKFNGIYVSLFFMRIPYLVGFLISSVFTYYSLLLSTFYFTELYRRTSLCLIQIKEDEPAFE